MLVNDGGSDAMDRVAAFLQWEDLNAITRCCRATRDQDTSAFYRAWVASTTLVLPPDSLASHAILSTITDIDAVVVPHSKWLDVVLADKDLAPRLARVRRVTLDRDRFRVKPRQELYLSVIADAFPATTHLVIHRLDYVCDAREPRAFRGLRRLELSSETKNLACPISATDFRSLEQLKLTRIDIRTIVSKQALIELRSLQVHGLGTIQDLAFLRCTPRLTELSLEIATVAGAAVQDLCAIAPQLRFFKCGMIEHVWSSNAMRVDADRLALAFKNLETLIWRGWGLDLSTISLIDTLQVLDLSFVAIQDLSPLSRLTRLERLHIRSNTFVDVTPLATLPRLVSLSHSHIEHENTMHPDWISLHHLQDFEGSHHMFTHLRDLDNLLEARVTFYKDEQLKLPLHSRAPRLRKLEIPQRSELGDLHLRFPRLRELSLTTRKPYSDSMSLQPLSHVLADVARLHDLQSLSLGRQIWVYDKCHSFDFKSLSPMLRLRKLELDCCKCVAHNNVDLSVYPLRERTWWRPILDLTPVASLQELREFKLKFCRAADLSPLERLPSLQVLTLECATYDVTPLTRIPSLRVVELVAGVDFAPLIIAYHAARLQLPGAPASMELREVKRVAESFYGYRARRVAKNCLWGNEYYSPHVQFQLKAMAKQVAAHQHHTGIDATKASTSRLGAGVRQGDEVQGQGTVSCNGPLPCCSKAT